ncbi:MAG TPA: hemolysin III family protein [Blastocatellia bacterium]|nr:hemolysin III family protein [Blastocatellia bacterium]
MVFWNQRHIEEIANSVTHGVGLAMSLAGLIALVILAFARGGVWHIVGCCVYGATLVALYAASTLYHSVQHPRLKRIFLVADQVAIYLLIAGTYTPFTLVNLRGRWGWSLLALVWTLALFGIGVRVIFAERRKAVTMALYLAIAWMAIIAVKPIFATVPLGGLAWIGAGGLAYMTGLVFFAWDRLPFNHAIWHLFVMAGSGCHYFAVVFYVLPPQA